MNKLFQLFYTRKNRKKIYSKNSFWDSNLKNLNNEKILLWRNKNLNYLYHNEQIDYFKKLKLNFRKLQILDLGCGIGRMSIWFAKQGAKVTAIDFSSKSLEVAKLINNHKNIKYINSSVIGMKYERKYDLIVSLGCLSAACINYSVFSKVVYKMVMNTKKNGHILMLEPFHGNFLSRVLVMNVNKAIDIFQSYKMKLIFREDLNFWPIRVLMCHFNINKFVTYYFFRLGQIFLKIRLFKNQGDYKLLFFIKKN